jgi:ribosomal subunit interface protein
MSATDKRGFPSAEIVVTTRGDVSDAVVGYAKDKIEKVFRFSTDPIRSAQVVLTQSADPAVQRPALAEVSLEFDGTYVRAQAPAVEMRAAVHLVSDRLQRTLVKHRDRGNRRHRWLGEQAAHEWRHGTEPSRFVDHFRRPPQDRELVRRKTFALPPMTVDEAAFDMDLMGHEFYLFVDLDSGHDAVIHRTPDGGYAVRGELEVPKEAAVEVEQEGPAPVLGLAEAEGRLDLAGDPFVFYLDRESGRGRVLYLRYDGHYGLIEAA